MVAGITIRKDGKAEAAFALEPAWHGLGTLMTKRMTAHEALVEAHLDWDVEKVPLYIDRFAEFEEIPDRFAILRCDDGNYLGNVGNQYTPIQNREQADYLQDLIGDEAVIECAGSLFGGRRTFWTCKLTEDMVLPGNDVVTRYLILANGHDGSLSFRVFWSPIRVVCQNTLNAALSRKGRDGIALNHCSGIKERAEAAKKLLGIADRYYKRLAQEFERLMGIPCTLDDMMKTIVPETLIYNPDAKKNDADYPSARKQANAAQIESNFTNAPGASDSLFGAYSAVTYFTSHQRIVKGSGEKTRPERRFESILLTDGKNMQQRAFDSILRLAEDRAPAAPELAPV